MPFAGPQTPLRGTIGAFTASEIPLTFTSSPHSFLLISGVNGTSSKVLPFKVSDVLIKVIGMLAGYPEQVCTLYTSNAPPNALPPVPPAALEVTVKVVLFPVVSSCKVIVQFPVVLSNSVVPVRASPGPTMIGSLK